MKLTDAFRTYLVIANSNAKDKSLLSVVKKLYSTMSVDDLTEKTFRYGAPVVIGYVSSPVNDDLIVVEGKLGHVGHIKNAATAGLILSGILDGVPVAFEFNGTPVAMKHGDTVEEVCNRWREADAKADISPAERRDPPRAADIGKLTVS